MALNPRLPKGLPEDSITRVSKLLPPFAPVHTGGTSLVVCFRGPRNERGCGAATQEPSRPGLKAGKHSTRPTTPPTTLSAPID